jgi:hypothetical protein
MQLVILDFDVKARVMMSEKGLEEGKTCSIRRLEISEKELENWKTFSIWRLLLDSYSTPLGSTLYLTDINYFQRHTVALLTRKNNPQRQIHHISHLVHLIQSPDCVERIRNEYAELVDIFDPVHRVDKWLLITFSHYHGKYRKVLEIMISIWSTKQASTFCRIQQVREELLEEETKHAGRYALGTQFAYVIIHLGTLEMWQYLNENDTGAKCFRRSHWFYYGMEARDVEIMRDIVFFQDRIPPRHFAYATEYHRFWETSDLPVYWNILLSKIPAPESGDTCPYLKSLLYVRNEEFDVARKALFHQFIRNGHATSTDGDLILGAEIIGFLLRQSSYELERVQGELQRSVAKRGLSLLVSYPNCNLEATMDQFDNLEPGPSEERFINSSQDFAHFTPLMITIHCGMTELSAILVNAGAQIQKKALCGFSALQLAKNYCDGFHPREAYQLKKWYWMENEIIMVFLEEDLETFELLEEALRKRGETIDIDSILEDDSALTEYLALQQDDEAQGKPCIL